MIWNEWKNNFSIYAFSDFWDMVDFVLTIRSELGTRGIQPRGIQPKISRGLEAERGGGSWWTEASHESGAYGGGSPFTKIHYE